MTCRYVDVMAGSWHYFQYGEGHRHLGRALVDEDVVKVAVAEANEVAGHGVDGRGARVCQPLLKPGRRLTEVLQEEVVQAWREPCAHLHACHVRAMSNAPCQAGSDFHIKPVIN